MKQVLLSFLIIQFLNTGNLNAQTQADARGMTATNKRTNNGTQLQKIALIIGNSNYGSKSLPNAKNDANDIAKSLEEL